MTRHDQLATDTVSARGRPSPSLQQGNAVFFASEARRCAARRQSEIIASHARPCFKWALRQILCPAMRIARPILVVSTPIGVVFGLREAWRLAGPGMTLLMALMLAVVSAFIWMTVRTIRRERGD